MSASQSSNSDLHIVFGAGPLGRATAAALSAKNQRVTLVNRTGKVKHAPAGVKIGAADLLNLTAAQQICQGAATVYFCAQPAYHRWPQEFPPLQDAVISAAASVGARLVVAENLYGYGEVSGPMTEDLPLRPNTRKGKARAAMHASLMRAHEAGTVQVAVARGSDFFGPWVEGSCVGSRAFQAIVSGKPVEVFGRPETPHCYTFIEDFGSALAILGTDARSFGQIWHVPNPPAVSTRQFMAIASRLAETSGKLRKLGAFELALVGAFIRAAGETVEMLYEFESPFLVDHQKFVRTFGDNSTPLEAAIARTIDWTRAEMNGDKA